MCGRSNIMSNLANYETLIENYNTYNNNNNFY